LLREPWKSVSTPCYASRIDADSLARHGSPLRCGRQAIIFFAAASAIGTGAGLDRAQGLQRGAGIGLQRIASGLAQPADVSFAPGEHNRVYVTERRGLIRVIQNGRLLPRPIADLRARVAQPGNANERGLFSLVFDPSFAESGRAYVSYSDRSSHLLVAELLLKRGAITRSPARILLTVSQKPFARWHFAGDLSFGRDGLLYVSTGDGGYWRQPGIRRKRNAPLDADPFGNSQNLAVLNAKLLRFDPAKIAQPEVIAYGLRNPWRFSIDSVTGDIWVGDVGLDRVEEVDVIRSGSPLLNFGWSVYEGRRPRNYRGRAPKLDTSGQLTWPTSSYGHGRGNCSITGGYVYRGSKIPMLMGRYLFGDLCSGRIWTTSAEAGRPSLRLEPFRIPQLTSFGEDEARELYATSLAGSLFKIVPR
jgi:glucose/arabinose dehydrogenase